MTQQPIESQSILDTIWSQHKALLLQRDGSEEAVDLEQVQVLLKTLAQAGTTVDDAEDRSLLHELIRYWSSFIDSKTGEFPVVQLQPFNIFLKQTILARTPQPSQRSLNYNDNIDQHALSPIEAQQAIPLLSAIWNIPYPRNPFFTGRDELLSSIHAQFQTSQVTALSQVQAISGLGGIGKTQIAVEYAYRYQQEYDALLWAHAENEETLISSYNAIAMLLALPERDAQEQKIIIQTVKIWLQTHGKWLLILDNADDLDILPPFLPTLTAASGHILLTTRARDMRRLATRVELRPLSDEQGASLLLRRAGLMPPNAELSQMTSNERVQAIQLTRELGGLPLALDQVGAYLEATGTSLEAYQQIYQRYRQALLQERRSLIYDHPEPIATTWSLSFEKLEQKNAAAADLLHFCAYLAPDAIPEEIIKQGASHLGPLLESIAIDSFQLAQAIEVLQSYSLLSRDSRTEALSVHRLVQAVLRDGMSPEMARQWKQRAVLAVNAACPDVQDVTAWNDCERWLPHALVCADWIEQELMVSSDSAHLLNAVGLYLNARARYREAEPLYLRALTIYEQQLGPDDPITALGLNNLAELYKNQGKYEEATPLYLRALAIREQQLGPSHPDTALSLNNLAELYFIQGRYADAEPLLKLALEIQELQLGHDHPDTATSLNNLAKLYFIQAKYSQAEPLLRQALAIYELQLGPEHPDTATSLNDLAELYQSQGKYEEAEPLYLRSLSIREQQLGHDHPDTATSLNNLGRLYFNQGKYSQAEPLLKQALEIYEQQLGLQHPGTVTIRENYIALSRVGSRSTKRRGWKRILDLLSL